MRDIFVCQHGNMLENWTEACPKALVTVSIRTVPVNEPVLFWVHANANNAAWLAQTMADIGKKFQVSKVVILANTPNQVDALAVMRKGAVGYCHAYSAAKMLKELKTVVTHGGVWLGNDLLQTLIGATKTVVHNGSPEVKKALALLTKREKQIALEAAKGLSNKEIARVFNIAERTVKAHVSATLGKLGVKDRLQLALILNEKSNDSKRNVSKIKTIKSKNGVKTPRATRQNKSMSGVSKKKLERVA
ncbi:MAG: helix-turn-helix transcriptional regulator [Methylophilaceae bacterium]|nr:MAG: helix-turn-helix transcriptional regulator [Methylophilaceae bacterium]